MILELKSIITKKKNSLQGLNIRFKVAEKKTNELKDR